MRTRRRYARNHGGSIYKSVIVRHVRHAEGISERKNPIVSVIMSALFLGKTWDLLRSQAHRPTQRRSGPSFGFSERSGAATGFPTLWRNGVEVKRALRGEDDSNAQVKRK